MTANTIEHPVADRALGAATLCEAFQVTAAIRPQQVALRTPGDAFVLTWEQYAERVRRTAAGLAPLGVRRGDTVARWRPIGRSFTGWTWLRCTWARPALASTTPSPRIRWSMCCGMLTALSPSRSRRSPTRLGEPAGRARG